MLNRTISKPGERKAGGFTLIELMITVVIVAILASIAIPSYQAQIRKSHRTDARTALLDIAGREERFMSVKSAYSQVPTDVGYSGTTWGTGLTVGSGYYTVVVVVGTAPPTYTVTATATGTQQADTACATLSVNQLGQQTATGSTTASVDCWK
jgi:type IV pilus assembly protein PilE